VKIIQLHGFYTLLALNTHINGHHKFPEFTSVYYFYSSYQSQLSYAWLQNFSSNWNTQFTPHIQLELTQVSGNEHNIFTSVEYMKEYLSGSKPDTTWLQIVGRFTSYIAQNTQCCIYQWIPYIIHHKILYKVLSISSYCYQQGLLSFNKPYI